MVDPLQPFLPGVPGPGGLPPLPQLPSAPPGGPSFRDLLKREIERVNSMQLDAEQAIEDLATGEAENVAEVLTAVEKADLAFQTLMQIRNKLLDAFEEINRLRI